MTTRRHLTGGLAAVAVTALTTAALAPGALAAPGNPGTPADPTVLLAEGFENGLEDGELVLLEDYVPDNASSGYTADPYWLLASSGNGLIIDNNTSDAAMGAVGYSPANPENRDRLRDIALAIGEINGSANPARNHAVSAYTDTDGPNNAVEFRTVDPIDLSADGRFLTVSANIGVTNCIRGAVQPQLVFLLDDGSGERAVNAEPIRPCPGNATDDAVAANIQGGNAVLIDGDDVQIIMRNATGNGSGNDHAFDDITVLDVTPQLDKVFVDEGEQLSPGDVTDLVLTVTNTSELGVKAGWSFTDALPEGLTVAGAVETTCEADVTAAEGDDSVVVENGVLAAGTESCSFTVPVTADGAGVFENSAANITSRGLGAPAATEIEYVADEEPPALAPIQAGPTGAESSSTLPAVVALAAGAGILGALGARRLRRQG